MTRYMRRRNVSQVFYEKLVIIIVLLFLLSTCSTVPTTNEVEPSRFSGDHTDTGAVVCLLAGKTEGTPEPATASSHCTLRLRFG